MAGEFIFTNIIIFGWEGGLYSVSLLRMLLIVRKSFKGLSLFTSANFIVNIISNSLVESVSSYSRCQHGRHREHSSGRLCLSLKEVE
jgi:hypothetical protein